MIIRTWVRKAFFFSKISFHIYTFYWNVSILALYTTSLCFQATGHSFSPRNMIFRLREPGWYHYKRLDNFQRIIFFLVKGVIFPFLLAIFNYNFGDSWYIHYMRPIILGYFFSNNYAGQMWISIQDHHGLFYGTYEKGMVIGPILDDGLKEKFLKPWKGVLCIHFRVCVSVCLHAVCRAHFFT